MNLRIDPSPLPIQTTNQTTNQSPITHGFPRRVDPIHHAHRTDRHADAIPFADYQLRSNLTYPAKPFWADRAQPDARPDIRPDICPDTQPARARPDVPRLGDVSPVEQQQSVHKYNVVLRFERTFNLGTIVDVIG